MINKGNDRTSNRRCQNEENKEFGLVSDELG